jgi:RHS repeat-associated protein
MLALPGFTDQALATMLKSLNSARVYPLLLQAGTLPLPVSVGFADSSSATANFPEPWNESNPLINFVGGGTAYRAGAIRLDNPTGSALTVDSVKVDLGRPGPVFALWSSITVPANGSAILTQTQDDNFNTSASPIVGCGQPLATNETRIPKITVTIAGAATDLLDTAHVLDTGGFDSSCRGNQSLDWRPIGSAGITSPMGAVQLSTQNAPHAVGTQAVLSVQVSDASSQPLGNVPVSVKVVNGPNAGKSFSAVTDATGNASIQYSSSVQGTDLLQASISNLSGGVLSSQQVSGVWTSADACAPLASTNSQAARLLYAGQTSADFGSALHIAALLTDGTGEPLAGRTVTFSFNGQNASATTDANGVATLSSTLPVGATTITSAYGGEAGFQAATITTSVTVQPQATLLRYTGLSLIASSGQQTVSAVLTDFRGATPVAGRTVNFTLNGVTANGTTDASGTATATLNFSTAQSAGAAQLQIAFAGDADYKASSRTTAVEVFQATSFVIWGGNSGGLKVGQQVNFWGAQWASQVTGGQWGGNPSFKGFADTLGTAGTAQCEANATVSTLDGACWQAKPGNSGPPATLNNMISVLVATAIVKSGSSIFGNIACTAMLRVNSVPAYGPDPGHPGFGVITAVSGDCAGAFPALAALSGSQQQTSPVLPGQQVTVNYTLANQGVTDATNVALNENFDQVTPATGSASIGTIAAGQSTTGSFQVTLPGIARRQSGESSTDYETRLAGSDGRLFTSEAEATFGDSLGQLYPPLDFSSFSQLTLPRLNVGLSGTGCIAPGALVAYPVVVENLGSASATTIAATLSLPDNSTATPVVPDLAAGTSFTRTVKWQSSPIAAKAAGETTAAYLGRLQSFDGAVLPAAVLRASWQDAAGNAYGSVEQPFTSITERVPVLSLATPASQNLLPGQKTQLSFGVSNTGSGNAVQATITLKRPDGSLLALPGFSLPGGQNATLTANYTAPVIASKGTAETDTAYLARLSAASGATQNLDAMLAWTDAAQSSYGPTDNPFTVTQQLPVVSVALAGPASANSGDTISWTLTATNSGSATAVVSAVMTLPDGSVQHPVFNPNILASGASAQTTVSFTIPASQPTGSISAVASLAWTDAAGNGYGPVSASATTQITQPQPKTPPVVSAGSAQTIILPAAAILNGSATENGAPVATVSWSKLVGPGTVVFDDAHSAQTQASFSAPGVYVLRLTATFATITASSDVTITIVDSTLSVNAGPNQTITFPGTITLNGTASSSAGKLGVTWSQADGPGTATFANASSAVTTVSFSDPGTYILRLTASDGFAAQSSDTTIFVGKLACTRSNAGTDFWLLFGGSIGDPNESLTLNISGESNTTGTVTIPGLQFSQDFTVTAEQVTTVTIPVGAVVRSTDQIESKGLHVVAKAPVTIHALDFVPGAADGFTALPTSVAGTDYVTIGFGNGDFNDNGTPKFTIGSEFAFVATQDNTTVTVSPAQKAGNRLGRIPYVITLNQGQTYQLQSNESDLTGSTLSSDKPIAVVSGHKCAFVPAHIGLCNLLEEQIPSTDLWGKNFVTMPLADRQTNGDIFRVVASQDQTQLKINGTVAATLNRGDFFEQLLGLPSSVAADKPVLLAQYSQGGNLDGHFVGQIVHADPFMVLVPPYDQFGGSYNVSLPTGFLSQYLNVVAPTAGLDGAIQLDGAPLSASSFTPVGDSGFSGTQIPVGTGAHHLVSTSTPFSLTAYGFAEFDGYGYYGGACFASSASGAQLQLAPRTLSPEVGSQNCVTASVSDAKGNPLGGAGVQLAITGANPQTASLTTDATGSAQFCYTGTNTGSDVITATSGKLSDTAFWTWIPAITNHAPIVNAGKNATIFLSQNTITLHGSVVDDGLPKGAQLTTQWTSLSTQLPNVIFSNAGSAITQATFSAPGVYVLQLSASDTQFTSTSTITVTVLANTPPVVSAGAPQTIYVTGTPGQFFGSISAALLGSVTDNTINGPVTLQWSMFSGPFPVRFDSPNSIGTHAFFSSTGVYLLALTAKDSFNSATAYVQVTVLTNQPPSVVLDPPEVTVVLDGNPSPTATFNVTITDDGLPKGSKLVIDPGAAFGVPAVLTPVGPNGQYTVTYSTPFLGRFSTHLSASDGLTTTTVLPIFNVVSTPPPPPQPPPTVSITAPADQADIHSPVPVTGSVSNGNWTLAWSTNNNGTGNFVTFASGSGTVTNGTLGTFDPSLLLNGSYTIRLMATDNLGQSKSTFVDVIVSRNRKLGLFTISFNDLTVPLPGLPVQIVRTYDSRNGANQGDFGFGWTLSLSNIRLQKSRALNTFWEETLILGNLLPQYCVLSDNNKFVTVTFPDGRMYKFQAQLTPNCQLAGPINLPTLSFVQMPGEAGTEGATLVPADGGSALVDGAVPGTFELVRQDGTIYDPTLFKLTTAEGFTYTLDQFKGLIQVADTNGNTLTVTPNGIIHSAGKSVTFTRDSQGRIISITDPLGKSLLYGYDGNGNLQISTDRAGNVLDYTYGSTATHPNLLQTIIDPQRNLNVLTNVYNPDGTLLRTDDPFNHETDFSIQPANNQETITDRNGQPTTYVYDNDGNVTASIDALGHRTDRTYDDAGNKLTETQTDDSGRRLTTTFAYDLRSNLTAQTDPLGNVTRYTYNDRKQVLTVTDPRGKVTSTTYDLNGNVLTSIDPLGGKTTYTYFSGGFLRSVQDAAGAFNGFTYDSAGNLARQTDAVGNVTSFAYDANNNKLSQTVTRTKADGTKESLTTQFVYDANNRLTKTINPDGTSTQTVYNSIGKQSDTIDALGRTTHYNYDANGNLSVVSYPDGTSDGFSYDNVGHRIAQNLHTSGFTAFTYDALGRQTKTTFVGATTQTAYDALGRVSSTTDANGNVTKYGYDDAGQRTSVTDALGHVSSFAYDANGNQTSFTDALNHTTKYVYDDAGRKTQTIFPDQTTETIAYDPLGRQISKTDQAGKVTQFGYDPLGRLATVTDALNQVTSYGYDELGNRIAQTDAGGHTTTFAYDQLGRRSGRTLPLGMSESYQYDAAGNLAARTDFNGHTTTYVYDKANRLLSKTADPFFSTGACAPTSANAFPCGATKVSYTYFTSGQRATMSDAFATWQYFYDGRQRLAGKLVPGTQFEVDWGYDAAGNLTQMSALRMSASYGYDALNRLITVNGGFINTGVVPVSYSYDAVGNLTGTQVQGVMNTSYSYDPLNRLTNLQSTCGAAGSTGCAGTCGTAAPGCALAGYSYTLGAAGNRLSVQELSGRTVQYAYDDLYRLTSETIAGASVQNGTVNYQYDAVGNRKQLTSTVAAIPATGLLNYDANDRISTQLYDNNGNTVNNGTQNVYDFENRLVRRGNVTIVYDGDGNRVSETVGGATVSYLVAEVNPTGYPQVVQERQNQFGPILKNYEWGLQLIAEGDLSQSPLHYYGMDGHGSVRYLTDTTGKITDTYDYDAFGNLISQTGTTANNYLFAGEQFDPALGVYYNRARFYDPKNGRFLNADPSEGTQDDPVSLHKYLYARNNPVSLIDPSGLDFLSDFEAGAEVQREIGQKFRDQFGSNNACVDQQIISIIASNCGVDRIVGLPFPGGFRPDLANIQTGALFEIKPILSAADGLLQIITYREILSLADPKGRNWHLGSADEFTPPFKIPLTGGLRVAYVAPPLFGVIVYFVADARAAFNVGLLAGAAILPALLSSAAAQRIAKPPNVISISRGTGIANAAQQSVEAEIEQDVATAELEEVA